MENIQPARSMPPHPAPPSDAIGYKKSHYFLVLQLRILYFSITQPRAT